MYVLCMHKKNGGLPRSIDRSDAVAQLCSITWIPRLARKAATATFDNYLARFGLAVLEVIGRRCLQLARITCFSTITAPFFRT